MIPAAKLLLFAKLLAVGAAVSLAISAVSILAGLAIAVPVSAAQLSTQGWLRRAGALYISFFRGVPLLVQLLLSYHMLPALGINLPGIAAAVIGLSLCTAAYQAENLRGGFANVPAGLVEAGRMVGLDSRQILLRIRLPLAVRLTLPAIVNEAILILKASSLVSVVGVGELTQVARNLSSSTFLPLPIFAMAGAYYIVLNGLVAAGGAALNRRLWRGT